MRKLRLQMQLTVDGFVAGQNGELDWIVWDWDDDLNRYVDELTDSIDTILLGRNMADGFISHWSNVITNPENPDFTFGKKMIDTPKVVFTKTLDKSEWENTDIATGNLVDEIKKLKLKDGKDIIVYGGAGFVSSLIRDGLIDEYHLFINPVALGDGMTIFRNLKKKQDWILVHAKSFTCGIVLLCYKPKAN
ncbi:dihydrofolate reductase family protein [candidate division KSB1 bacterium]|nr:dihydrofolate reductase family protein [candidate division KSB1 bacterium]NIV68549.1 dihydrofolate reductase [Phycisphaerae bacterium]NIR69104.1 dihydrofolate reductase family protein [candidate division KSB1 bacterium]NIS22635.1 dihydrofolate reductase family protein [candidate division KSB1 bacterium]NIT69493.1 dihydrofolate reductase family protein [candidate division KSB1 bacterium]